MTRRVGVTGIGLVSPAGSSLADVTRAFAAGEPGPREDRSDDAGLQVASIPLDGLSDERRARAGRLDRFCQLLFAASHLAVDAARLSIGPDNRSRVGVSFGTGLGCVLTNAEYDARMVTGGPAAASPRLFAYTVSSAAAGEVSIALGITGPNLTLHMGLAAGLGAVGYGVDLIRLGKADVVLAAGADALGPPIVRALADMRLLKGPHDARPFRDAVPGVYPAEAAAVVVLEDLEHARRRGAPLLAEIGGYAAGFEPTLTRRDRSPDGVTATLERALARGGQEPERVGAVIVSAHGTPLDTIERLAVIGAFGHSAPLLLAPKAVFGDTFGASGALALALGVGLLREVPRFGGAPARAEVVDVAFGTDGRPRAPGDVEQRLLTADAVLVSSLCYTGNAVALVATRSGLDVGALATDAAPRGSGFETR